MSTRFHFASLGLASALALGLGGTAGLAQAQATNPAVGASSSENAELANGQSVKRALMGRAVYNEQGARIGNIEDIILSADKRVPYAIVGAGGFIGIGRHDVAIPLSEFKETDSKMVLPRVTKDSLKALPAFDYANDTLRRERFIAAADKDIAQAKVAIADMEARAGTATAEAKAKLKEQSDALKEQVKTVETKLAELKSAGVQRWHEFEAAVSAATSRLRDLLKSGGG